MKTWMPTFDGASSKFRGYDHEWKAFQVGRSFSMGCGSLSDGSKMGWTTAMYHVLVVCLVHVWRTLDDTSTTSKKPYIGFSRQSKSLPSIVTKDHFMDPPSSPLSF